MNNYILALDGEAIQIKNPVVTLEQEIAEEDQSGQSSYTTASEQGQKAKRLSVTGIIEYSKSENLTHLYDLASAREENGTKKVYRIANSLAQSVKLRQCVFAGKITASPDSKFLAWNVSFSLVERFSVPEKKETNTAQQQEQSQEPIFRDEEEAPNAQELSGIENILKGVNDSLP